MSDVSHIVISWITIFFVFVALMGVTLFLFMTNKINTYHEQIDPIIERYGGAQTGDLHNRMASALNKRHSTIGPATYYVNPSSVKPADMHGNYRVTNGRNGDVQNDGAVKYGQRIRYKLNADIHLPFFNKSLDISPTEYTTSKVGEYEP